MTIALISLAALALLATTGAILAGVGYARLRHRHTALPTPPADAPRILFPYMPEALSTSAFEAALRLALAQDRVLVPVFLALVPMTLPLDAPLPRQSRVCVPLQERIDERAADAGVAVDHRIARGRTYRHALRQALAHERYQQLVIAAAADGVGGFGPDDVAWVLQQANGEIIVLRPNRDDRLVSFEPSWPASQIVPSIDVSDHEKPQATEPAIPVPIV